MKKAQFLSKWFFAVVGLLLLLSSHTLAQYPMINSNPTARALVTAGLDQVYDSQFTAAEATFTQLAKLAPNHPSLDLLRGVGLYYQWFPARTDINLLQRCRKQLELAARKADDWQKAQKKTDGEDRSTTTPSATARPEAMFLYFTAEAMLAKIGHYEHEPFVAIRHAKNAYPFIQKGKAFQQQYPDFYLSTGLYNFYREVYPEIHPFYKTVAWVMTSGDKKLGMNQLQIATQKALLVRTEAILYLTHLLTDYENKPGTALPYLSQLTVRYPDNPFWRYKYAEALLSAHQTDSVPALIALLMAAKEPVYQQMGTLLKARYALEIGQYANAKSFAGEVARSSVKDETVRAYAYQVLARVARQEGQEKIVRQYYKLMLEFAEYPVLRNEAP
ncbi:tetratricopeptide repeat protein [Spirosoma flavum]|uniref:Tetratricopeptide repeat protein n=1 Tax=Spirosoma flavum TaxID=2048557 RepID=A0ABW6AKV8_9BACT